MVGWVAASDIASVPTPSLANESFTVLPEDIPGWERMAKRTLKAAMQERRSFLYKQEKARRAAADIFACTPGAALSSRHRKRTRAEMEASSSSSETSGFHVAIDCAYEHLMDASERNSLTEQVCVSLSSTLAGGNQRLSLHLTGCNDEMLADLTRRKGFLGWPMHVYSQPLETVFRVGGGGEASAATAVPAARLPRDARHRAFCVYAKHYDLDAETMGPVPPGLLPLGAPPSHELDAAAAADDVLYPPPALPIWPPPVVYLTADTDTVLTQLAPGTIYVVGGLVDRNRHKGVAAARATSLALPTARLPLQEFLAARGGPCPVLTTNHVVAILQSVACNGGDWAAAFEAHLPRRKGFAVAPPPAPPPTTGEVPAPSDVQEEEERQREA